MGYGPIREVVLNVRPSRCGFFWWEKRKSFKIQVGPIRGVQIERFILVDNPPSNRTTFFSNKIFGKMGYGPIREVFFACAPFTEWIFLVGKKEKF